MCENLSSSSFTNFCKHCMLLFRSIFVILIEKMVWSCIFLVKHFFTFMGYLHFFLYELLLVGMLIFFLGIYNISLPMEISSVSSMFCKLLPCLSLSCCLGRWLATSYHCVIVQFSSGRCDLLFKFWTNVTQWL